MVASKHRMPAKESDTYTSVACAESVADDTGGNPKSGGKALIHPQRYNLKHRFELMRTLGEGTYGKVKLALEKATGEQVAIKYVKKTKIRDETDLNRIRREIRIMSMLRHENIVNIRQVFEKKDRIVLVMDCALGGELYDYLNSRRVLKEAEVRRIFRQIVAALHYIHQNGIVHRDLKLENIILDSEGNVKIADFGLANYFSHNDMLKTFCGSPLYASPEIVNGKPYHGPEVDVWSLGVVLYTLAYGAMPFESSNPKILREQISTGDFAEPSQPCGAAGLIRHMLTVNPARRATLKEVLNHWWLNMGHDLTPDGRVYEPSPLLVRRSHRHHSSFSSDSDLELDSRSPPPGVRQRPGSRTSKKSVETSFDEDEVLYDIGRGTPQPAPSSPTPAESASTSTSCDRAEDDASRTSAGGQPWQRAIASGIEEIKARVIQSLAADEALRRKVEVEDKNGREGGVREAVPAVQASSESLENEKTRVFHSEKKPRRGILKRGGKFSGGDSGCCINETSPKAAEEVLLSRRSLPADPSALLASSHLYTKDLTFLPPSVSVPGDSQLASSTSSTTGPALPQADSPSCPPGVGAAWHTCPVHRLHSRYAVTSLPQPPCPTPNTGKQGLSGLEPLSNAQCTCSFDPDPSKVVRRRKGILKTAAAAGTGGANRGSLMEDARKRLSIGSLSSNSSADILDLSYDSGDGEQFLQQQYHYHHHRPRSRNSLVLEAAASDLQAGDRCSFSLEGEFTALSLDGLESGRHLVDSDRLFDCQEAHQVCQQALDICNRC